MPQKPEAEVVFGAITQKNVKQLEMINLELFPVRYPPKFYTDVISHYNRTNTYGDLFTSLIENFRPLPLRTISLCFLREDSLPQRCDYRSCLLAGRRE